MGAGEEDDRKVHKTPEKLHNIISTFLFRFVLLNPLEQEIDCVLYKSAADPSHEMLTRRSLLFEMSFNIFNKIYHCPRVSVELVSRMEIVLLTAMWRKT